MVIRLGFGNAKQAYSAKGNAQNRQFRQNGMPTSRYISIDYQKNQKHTQCAGGGLSPGRTSLHVNSRYQGVLQGIFAISAPPQSLPHPQSQ
jgi:hypothetical protein